MALATTLLAAAVVTASLAPVGSTGPRMPLGGNGAGAAPLDTVTTRALLRGGTTEVPATLPAVLPQQVSVVSAEDGLPDVLVTAIGGLDVVVATTPVRSANVGLFGSTDADGVPRDVVPRGMRIPVSVTAVDPATYVPVLGDWMGEGDAALLRALVPGEVLLSRSSAALRGLDVGGRVDLGAGRDLRVAGVVDDVTTRGNEFLVLLAHADTVDLDFGGRDALLVRHVGSSVARAAIDALAQGPGTLRASAPSEGDDEDRVRVWHPGRRTPLVLSTVEVKERFGEFAFRLVRDQREVDIERAFFAVNIVEERMPVIGTVRCHRLIMDDLRAAVDEMIAAGFEDWLSPRRYAGCYYPRRIGFGRETLSRHSWGIAIDLNVDFSLPGAGPVAPDELVAIMGRHGFRWGGDFTTPDNHHFEWVGEAALVRPDRGADGA